MEKYGRAREATDETKIRCLCFACCMSKPTHSSYVMLFGFARQQWLHEHLLCLYIHERLVIPWLNG